MDVNGVLSTEKTQASRFTLDTVVEDEGLNLSVGEVSMFQKCVCSMDAF